MADQRMAMMPVHFLRDQRSTSRETGAANKAIQTMNTLWMSPIWTSEKARSLFMGSSRAGIIWRSMKLKAIRQKRTRMRRGLFLGMSVPV